MCINLKNVQLCQKKVKLLGVTLNREEITPSEIKQNEALEFPTPHSMSDVRRFFGLAVWFRSFNEDYAEHTIALSDSLKGKNNRKWTKEMNKSLRE